MSDALKGAAAPLRLLLVDDDSVDRMAVVRALAQSGLQVETSQAASAAEALERLRAQEFDCVLLDLNLPDQDGAFVLRTALGEGFAVPIIMLTGQDDGATAARLMRSGAADYLVKGALRPAALEQSIQRAIRLHQAEAAARAATAALAASESRLRVALDAAALGTWEFNPASGEKRFDERWDELVGTPPVSAEEIEAFLSHVHEADRERVRLSTRPEQMTADGGHATEFRYRKHGIGPWKNLRSIGRQIFSQGQFIRYVGTIQDVTVFRHAEAETKRRAEFEQQLLGIVSHDLRNPISAMLLSAHLLRQREDLPPGADKALGRIISSGDRSTRMLRDLLDFTQARVGGGLKVFKKWGDLRDVVRSVADEVEANFPAREIRTSESGDAQGEWDEDRVAQLLTNLVVNALTYSPRDTPVTVTLTGNEDEVTLNVQNWGAPIPQDQLASLFEPFKRGSESANRQQRSIGLGLYIVREIAVAHDGRVVATSDAAHGTNVKLTLPRFASPAP